MHINTQKRGSSNTHLLREIACNHHLFLYIVQTAPCSNTNLLVGCNVTLFKTLTRALYIRCVLKPACAVTMSHSSYVQHATHSTVWPHICAHVAICLYCQSAAKNITQDTAYVAVINDRWPAIHDHEIIFNARKFLKAETESEIGDKKVEYFSAL